MCLILSVLFWAISGAILSAYSAVLRFTLETVNASSS
jgi:hypothetical protein